VFALFTSDPARWKLHDCEIADMKILECEDV
jgi:hypothetical protein